MPISNPSFEEVGALPGEAAGWTLTCVCTAEQAAGFGPPPESAREDFERWLAWMDGFGEGDLVFALFDALPEAREDFEEGFANETWLGAWHPGFAEACVFGDDVAESFDAGWATDAWARGWDEVASEAAAFGADPHEDFGVEPWRASWNDVTDDAARFDGGTTTEETFAGTWEPATTV